MAADVFFNVTKGRRRIVLALAGLVKGKTELIKAQLCCKIACETFPKKPQ
jgi:hypothetical protein